MPVNRKLFTLGFAPPRFPNWRCPRCDGGHLRLIPETFRSERTGDTLEAIHEEWFDFDMVETRFVGMLRCDNDTCKEIAAVAGRGRVVEDPNPDAHKMDYSDVFEATYVLPSPPLIQVPAQCPDLVKEKIVLANTAQWDDPGAAATHVRGAVELLLNELQIESTRKGRVGDVRLTLHDRIARLREKQPEQADALLATKWIGNAGAHEVVTRDDVFDMMDILERVLDALYGHAEVVAQLVKAVNNRKGPARGIDPRTQIDEGLS